MARQQPIRLGIVGVGKIARDQHLPAIAANPDFRLVAAASRNADVDVDGVANHASIEAMIAADGGLEAVTLCTPPAGRHAQARAAIDAGLHVMLEKPPAATLAEIEDLRARAEAAGVTLFATWHSRMAAGVEPARAWLAGRRIAAARIAWREDIRRWHPGQEWILGPGGYGVFDPGINAFSILTALLPDAVIVERADLATPEGRASPIAATLSLRSGTTTVAVELDFLQTGPQTWDIEVDTDLGMLRLADGGAILTLPGEAPRPGENREYPELYARFADLIADRRSDADIAPLRLVADAFLAADRRTVEPFSF